MYRWFTFDPEGEGFMVHETEELAIEWIEELALGVVEDSFKGDDLELDCVLWGKVSGNLALSNTGKYLAQEMDD